MKIGRILPVVFVVVWFYLLIAVLVNPAFTPPITGTNPVMPFLSVDAINMIWPIILLLTPIVLILVQHLLQPVRASRRQVSPQEFTRIQARAHATSESIREGVRRQELPGLPRATSETTSQTKSIPSSERPFPKLNDSAPSETKSEQETSKSEFTPPPTTLREAVFGKANAGAEAEEPSATEPTTNESVSETTVETTDSQGGIEELEAEKGAVSSLKTRLEEMKSSGTIEPTLYEKLSKKYTSEIERIDNKIEKLDRKEKKKTSKN